MARRHLREVHIGRQADALDLLGLFGGNLVVKVFGDRVPVDAAWARRRGQAIVLKVLASWLIAVALLKAIYEMVDRVKAWETKRGIDGGAAFQARCAELDRSYDELEARLGIPTGMRGSRLQRLLGRRPC